MSRGFMLILMPRASHGSNDTSRSREPRHAGDGAVRAEGCNLSAVPSRLRIVRAARLLGAIVGGALLTAASCSSRVGDVAGPPAHAGALVVHAVMTLGPVNERTGRAAGEFAMSGTRVSVRSTDGTSLVAPTDRHGNARFELTPGRYVARLADLAQPDGQGGGPQLDCLVGAFGASVRVLPHRTVHVEVTCVQP